MGVREEFWNAISEIEIAKNLSIEMKQEMLSRIDNILRTSLPDRVFKYRSCSTRNIDALARNVLYAVPASYMNDPFDSLVYVDKTFITESIKYGLSRKFINDIREARTLPEPLKRFLPEDYAQELLDNCLKLTEEEINEKIEANTKILQSVIDNVNNFIDVCIKDLQNRSLISSFANSPFDSSMWNRYAGDNTGFVLEYAIEDTRFDFCWACPDIQTDHCDKSVVQAYWYPIVYREERFDATAWVDYKITDIALSSSDNRNAVGYMPDILMYDKCCLVKGKAWEKEQEWRLVCYPAFPMVDTKPVAIHTPCPRAIYYGYKISDEDFRLLHKTIEDLRSKGAKIKEFRMYLDPYSRDFELKVREIATQ